MATLQEETQKHRERPLTPLLDYVEHVENEIHQNPSDTAVANIIEENFSPDFRFKENETPLTLASFKTLSDNFRRNFLAVDITNRRPIVHKTDPLGRGGVVGFATEWVFEQKSDRKRFKGDTIEIFTVTWFPEEGEPAEGRRMITNAQAAIGDLSPVKTLKVKGKREKDEEGRVAKGRVSKVKTRSKAL